MGVVDGWTFLALVLHVSAVRMRGTHTRPPQPYSAKSIKNIYECVIGATIRFAIKRGYIPANQYVFDDVVLPAYRGTTVRLDQIPVGNEVGAWIECGYAVGELAGDIVLLGLGTGMRWGEIAGLAPFEHDYENALLTVAWVVKEGANRKCYIDDLRGKSDHAIRRFEDGNGDEGGGVGGTVGAVEEPAFAGAVDLGSEVGGQVGGHLAFVDVDEHAVAYGVVAHLRAAAQADAVGGVGRADEVFVTVGGGWPCGCG
jgi:hypothetical protein